MGVIWLPGTQFYCSLQGAPNCQTQSTTEDNSAVLSASRLRQAISRRAGLVDSREIQQHCNLSSESGGHITGVPHVHLTIVAQLLGGQACRWSSHTRKPRASVLQTVRYVDFSAGQMPNKLHAMKTTGCAARRSSLKADTTNNCYFVPSRLCFVLVRLVSKSSDAVEFRRVVVSGRQQQSPDMASIIAGHWQVCPDRRRRVGRARDLDTCRAWNRTHKSWCTTE